MLVGEIASRHYLSRHGLAVDVPPWQAPPSSSYDEMHSPSSIDLLRCLVLNDSDDELGGLYSSDEFRMFEFKVRRCTRGRSHDWTECPYAHPGEKARRRDPKKFHYSGTACPDFRKGGCKRGDSCEFAHGVFECWLHPSRYRTQACKDGTDCRRRVCFFAHTAEQLRVVSTAAAIDSYDGSPMRHHIRPSLESFFPKSLLHSPPSPAAAAAASPPRSPIPLVMRRYMPHRVNDLAASLDQIHVINRCASGFCDLTAWEVPAGRVESGRDLRAKIGEKLGKENGLQKPEDDASSATPDVDWVTDLVD